MLSTPEGHSKELLLLQGALADGKHYDISLSDQYSIPVTNYGLQSFTFKATIVTFHTKIKVTPNIYMGFCTGS